jgi:hypothetical protein
MLPALPPTPPPPPGVGKSKGGCPSQHLPGDVDLSVFDVLNIFRHRWFLSRTNLVTNIISAQKAEDGNISWVEFPPPFHSHLVKCAVALVPHRACPVPTVKRVMFVFILELLNREGHLAFFDLQKGSRKANNAQKEKRHLARKWSRAAKREREREATKVAELPPRERECLACGRKFKSRKTAKKHKCSKNSKVVREKEADAPRASSHPAPTAQLIKPAAPITPLAPTDPSYSSIAPPVTRDLGDSRDYSRLLLNLDRTALSKMSRQDISTMATNLVANPYSKSAPKSMLPALQAQWQMIMEEWAFAALKEGNMEEYQFLMRRLKGPKL